MEQVLFWIPIKTSMSPEGIPVYAYGAMLFITFVTCVVFATLRARQLGLGLTGAKVQDLAIALFVFGLAGARLTYMLQYNVPLSEFFKIWKGGIVLYGGIIGGTAAFIVFHRMVVRPLGVTLWQMGDLAAPCVCIGIALGRVGCLLNGCCYGNIANNDCPALQFPLLTCPAREMLVDKDGLQTAVGFQLGRDRENADDVRTVVGKVEPESAAAAAGLQEGDKILRFRVAGDWQPNGEILFLSGKSEDVSKAVDKIKELGVIGESDSTKEGETVKFIVQDPHHFGTAYDRALEVMRPTGHGVPREDVFANMLGNWPRGRNSVQFVVERAGSEKELDAFTPRTIGLHPTQVYETISMFLLLLLVLSFYPFRQHDGQVWVVFMIAYACHRFLNEMLRIEPAYVVAPGQWHFLQLTLSQIISVLMIVTAIGLEIYLRKTQPKRQPFATAAGDQAA